MNPTIQAIRFIAEDRLQNLIKSKSQKLNTFFDRIVDVQVFLWHERNHQHGGKVVELKVNVPNNTLLATHQANTFDEALDQALDNMKRQLKRHKDRLRA